MFVLQFQSGTMEYWDVTVDPPVKESADLVGLQFGFDVNLAAAAVAIDGPLPDDVKKRVTELLTYLGPGAFTIQQLFMDLQNAVLSQYDPAVTVFPFTMSPSARAAFPQYLAQYMAQLQSAGGNILGYAVTVSDTADLPATFPPTSLEFVTNQYQGGPDGTTLDPDLDTINYLMMTGGQGFPGNLLPWWGDFVVPGDDNNGWYGTMAMANDLFIQQFLLPRLAPLVLQYWTFSHNDGSLLPDYSVQSGTFTPQALGGTWSSGTQSGTSHRTNTFSNDDIAYTMTITATLAVLPGTNTIQIIRNTDFDILYTHWYGAENNALKSQFQVWYNVPLTITIELLGIMNGQLQVNVTSTTRQKNPNTNYSDPYGWDITQTAGSTSIWNSIVDDMDTAINTMVGLAMPTALLPGVATTIQENLNFAPFVFPGGAQLFMANPEFTDAGDLLLGLQYEA